MTHSSRTRPDSPVQSRLFRTIRQAARSPENRAKARHAPAETVCCPAAASGALHRRFEARRSNDTSATSLRNGPRGTASQDCSTITSTIFASVGKALRNSRATASIRSQNCPTLRRYQNLGQSFAAARGEAVRCGRCTDSSRYRHRVLREGYRDWQQPLPGRCTMQTPTAGEASAGRGELQPSSRLARMVAFSPCGRGGHEATIGLSQWASIEPTVLRDPHRERVGLRGEITCRVSA